MWHQAGAAGPLGHVIGNALELLTFLYALLAAVSGLSGAEHRLLPQRGAVELSAVVERIDAASQQEKAAPAGAAPRIDCASALDASHIVGRLAGFGLIALPAHISFAIRRE